MPTIEMSRPTAQYTEGHEDAHVQFAWRVAAAAGAPVNEWIRASYSPSQTSLSARAPAGVLAAVPGYWGDAEVRADVLAFMAATFGFTDVRFLEPAPVAS